MTRALPLLSLLLLGSTLAGSGQTFSPDGKSLWVSTFNEKSGTLLVLRKGAAPIQIPLPAAIRDDGGAAAIEMDGTALLVAGHKSLWSWEPGKPDSVPQQLADLPDRLFPTGVHRMRDGGLKGTIFLTGSYSFGPQAPKPADFDETRTFFGLQPGSKTFGEVFVRRVDKMTAPPAWNRDRMVFGAEGDLWCGGISFTDEESLPYSLSGYRCAPIALMNTDSSNSGSLEVRELAIAGDTVWASLQGHHLGALVRVPLTAPRTNKGHPDFAEAWKIASKQLSEAKVIQPPEDSDSFSGLCSWNGPHGDWKIAFRTHYRTWWLWEKDSKAPVKLGNEPTP